MSTKKKSTEPVKFAKVDLQRSAKLRDYRDAASAVLKDDELYTVDEALAAIAKYMKGKVK